MKISSLFNNHKKILFLILGISIFYSFYRLGATDLIEWDEAYYSDRVAVVFYDGEWLDQSSLAYGGLWTGSHPPLVIWIMTISCKIFGFNEWGLRIPIAMFGILIIILVFFFTQSLTQNTTLALLSSIILLMISFFIEYTRKAQLDIPVLFLMMLTVFLFWQSLKKNPYRYAILAGIVLGLGLMSKIIVAFLAVGIIAFFIVWEFFRGDKKIQSIINLIILFIIGLLVVLPWHILITQKYGLVYWEQAYGYHVFKRMSTTLENHTSVLGILYWPMEILKKFSGLFPFIILGMFTCSQVQACNSQEKRFLWSAFLVPFMIFSLTSTKFHTYFLLFSIPLAIFCAIGIWYTYKNFSTTSFIMLPLSIASLVWVQTHPLHRAFEEIVFSVRNFSFPALQPIISLGIFIGIFCGMYFLSVKFLIKIKSSKKVQYILYSIFFVLPIIIMSFNPLIKSGNDWEKILSIIKEKKAEKILYVGNTTAVVHFYMKNFLERNTISVEYLPVNSSEEQINNALHNVSYCVMGKNNSPQSYKKLSLISETGKLSFYKRIE